ncbi:hypothetical protein SNE25_06655 [Mucilaginibacter sabulilitoris]|uniref:Alpha/beta hydrolase n=1 Tax=Mucilaginibacter sabulilitoris TaxID=1173583 RepID=A0ABZ0TPY5_9SPHI|nr:hypothetical protein [Mucilaginibacter sabulilitoris]WPU95205.1 hypothetical protein SNE25_06655 [Mucilaginibacter sabulilitoris]
MKHRYILFCLSPFFYFNCSQAQDINKFKLNVVGREYEYYETQPTTPAKGLVILLPALGEKPKSIFKKTTLPKLITANGYITIALEIAPQMFADEDCVKELNELIKIKRDQYKLTYKDIAIGGLSDGGAIALCFAEFLNSKEQPVKLKAVFAIDPPADLTRIYASAEKEISYRCPLIAREGKSTKAYLDNIMGGSPATNPRAYIQRSAYFAKAPDGGNAQFLKYVPVRLYSEPDLEYVRKTYCPELQYSNLNAFDLDKMIVFLKSIGNERSEYITTKGKGFHSWNIIDAGDCAKWITEL